MDHGNLTSIVANVVLATNLPTPSRLPRLPSAAKGPYPNFDQQVIHCQGGAILHRHAGCTRARTLGWQICKLSTVRAVIIQSRQNVVSPPACGTLQQLHDSALLIWKYTQSANTKCAKGSIAV